MSESEIEFWVEFYLAISIIGVFSWCIGTTLDMHRERKQRKRIDKILNRD